MNTRSSSRSNFVCASRIASRYVTLIMEVTSDPPSLDFGVTGEGPVTRRNPKFEIRISPVRLGPKQVRHGESVLWRTRNPKSEYSKWVVFVLKFEFESFEFVSDFDIRVSSFSSAAVCPGVRESTSTANLLHAGAGLLPVAPWPRRRPPALQCRRAFASTRLHRAIRSRE